MAPNSTNSNGDCPTEQQGHCCNIHNSTNTCEGPPCNIGHDSVQTKPPHVPKKDGGLISSRPTRLSLGKAGLQRAASDVASLSCEMPRMSLTELSSVEEEQLSQCECCGLSEECTPAYIGRVRDLFCGRWICGLCAEAVKEERHRMGRGTPMEEALQAHMSVCVKFNKLARTNPAVHVADVMRQLLKKKSMEANLHNGLRSNPNSPRLPKGNLARSTSCIPAITRDFN
eukprot:Gb_05142 [translate_table: standard]